MAQALQCDNSVLCLSLLYRSPSRGIAMPNLLSSSKHWTPLCPLHRRGGRREEDIAGRKKEGRAFASPAPLQRHACLL